MVPSTNSYSEKFCMAFHNFPFYIMLDTHAITTSVVRIIIALTSAVAPMCFCFSGTMEQHPLMSKAMVLAQNSVMESSQKSYRSTWNKWELFLHKYFPPVWTDTHYNNIDYTTLLDRLLMFVTYLAHELRCNVRSIPTKCQRYVMAWFPAWSSAAMRSTTICYGP